MKTTLKNLLSALDEAGIKITNPRSGVRFYEPTKRWQCWIKVNGSNVHLGYFQSLYDAVLAREAAEAHYYPNGRPPKKKRGKKASPEVQTISPTEDDDFDESEFYS